MLIRESSAIEFIHQGSIFLLKIKQMHDVIKIETFINKYGAFSSERQTICTCICFDKRYNAWQEMMQEFSRQLQKILKIFITVLF